jgi:hypothetical protein
MVFGCVGFFIFAPDAGGRVMTIVFSEPAGGKLVEVRLSGKLHKADYEHFVPEVEKAIAANGKIRVLMEMHDFHGWDLPALWQDIKFDRKHHQDIERIAMVGDKKWESGMAAFCKPFTGAKIRYFDVKESAAAREWIAEP